MPLLVDEKTQARLLRISHHHLVNLRNRRAHSFVKLGKSIRYNPDRVAKALEKLTVEEHTQPPKGAKR
jgi:hypothetical protein